MRLTFKIDPKRLRNWLMILALGFSLTSIISEYLVEFVLPQPTDSLIKQFLDLFSVNLEGSFPTWYSTILLFVVAVIVLLVAVAKFRAGDKHRWYWSGLGIIFLYLSADEGAGVHEIFVDTIRQTFNTTGFFEFGWQLVAIPVVVVLIVLYARFVYQLPSITRRNLILSAVVYLGGALIVEGISANQWYMDNGLSMRYLSIATIEELMEMFGAIGFCYTLLDYFIQSDYTVTLEADLETTPRKSHRRITLRKAIIPLLMAINFVALGWMMMIIPHDVVPDDDTQNVVTVPFYYELQEQVLVDGGVIVEVSGVFGIENLTSRQLGRILVEQYPIVIAISQPTRDVSTIVATNTIDLEIAELTELLHRFGQTNFIIFDSETVRGLSRLP